MAIAFDASSEGSATAATATIAHACSGSDRILLVGIEDQGSTSDRVSSVTYNGVAMTRLDSKTGTGRSIYLYMLVAPATGANDIVVTFSTSLTYIVLATSYTGTRQTSQPNVTSNTDVGGTTELNIPVTTTYGATWLVGFMYNAGGNFTAGAGTTLRVGVSGLPSSRVIADSNGTNKPAGTYALIATHSAGEDGGIVTAIKEAQQTTTVSDTTTVTDAVRYRIRARISDTITATDSIIVTALRRTWSNITKSLTNWTNQDKS